MNNKTFLIIDDDEDDRMFLKDAIHELAPSAVCLESQGCVEVISILHKAEQLPYCIFLDINMPGISGRECLELIKKDPKLRDIKVIIYSTASSDKSIAEFLSLGAAGYLNKPNDLSKLPAHILAALKSSEFTT